MESLQARVDSFLKSKRIKKTAKSNSTSTTVKWPHPASFNANPQTLAEAGFYWAPSWEDRDSVICFLCHKELSDWNEEDDPFQIHWDKCGRSCAWAMLRCGLSQDIADDGSFVFLNKGRFPTSKTMKDARLRTFGALWPHDADDDHGATSEKVAHAGFVYNPHTKGDDTATCLYCNVTLNGWDKDDDPMLEHKKRATTSGKRCPFFGASGGKASHSKKQSSFPTHPPAPLKSEARQTRAVSRTRSKQVDVDISPDLKSESSDPSDELGESEVVEEVQAPKTRGKGRVASTSKPPPKAALTGKKSRSTKSTRAKVTKSAPAGPSNSALANPPDEAALVASEVEMDVIASETGDSTLDAIVDAPVGVDSTPVQQIRTEDSPIQSGQQSNDADLDDLIDTPHPPPRPGIPYGNDAPMVVDETSQVYGRSPSHPPSPPPPCQSAQPATLPALRLEMLTAEDRCLTVEQWIRREIEISYDQLRQDGRKQISLFEGRAREVRQVIEAL